MRLPTLSLLLLASLALAGCGNPATSLKEAADKAGASFTSIKDAVDRSIALRCEYTDEDGEKTIAYIKGKEIRLDSAKEGENGFFHGIIRDNKMWIWADKQPEGLMLDFSKITDDSLKMGDKAIRSQDDVVAKLEEKKDTCKNETVADSQFALPDTIKFTNPEDIQAPATSTPTSTQ